ncbi:MAG: hypothetical protein AAF914_12015 [Pseudomonadota bacterium]
MADKFANHHTGLESPATSLASVTPDDGTDLPNVSRAIAVATSGMVRVTAADGTQGEVFVAAGVPFPIRVARVWATGTTATGIVALA